MKLRYWWIASLSLLFLDFQGQFVKSVVRLQQITSRVRVTDQSTVAYEAPRKKSKQVFLSIRAGASTGIETILSSIIQKLFDWLSHYVPSYFTGKRSKRYGLSNSNSAKSHGNSNSDSKRQKASSKAMHLSKKYKAGDPNNRIQKELQAFLKDPPENMQLSVGKNIRSWIVTMKGVDGTIYAGEKYKLKIVFPKDYPAKPVSAYFLKPTPKHVHVYSNGDICCSLLGKDWRPTMTAQLIAVSILSMLSSAKEKSMPQDNAMHADQTPGLAQDKWMYHDDKC